MSENSEKTEIYPGCLNRRDLAIMTAKQILNSENIKRWAEFELMPIKRQKKLRTFKGFREKNNEFFKSI
jgi:hypothetical protein